MAESPCSPPMTSITAEHTLCCNNVNRPCAPPGVIILNVVRGIPKPLLSGLEQQESAQ